MDNYGDGLVSSCTFGDDNSYKAVSILFATNNYSKKDLRRAVARAIEFGNFKTFDLLATKIDVPKFNLSESNSAGFRILTWGWDDTKKQSSEFIVVQSNFAENCYRHFQTISRKQKIKNLDKNF